MPSKDILDRIEKLVAPFRVTDGNRFRLLIGVGFLVIVFWSSDGVVGLWERWRPRSKPVTGAGGGARRGAHDG